ncbi:MAG TPA: hypothetical protein VFR11_10100 [Micromonosporaceae bacterium]|jgi:hypothetical protein|nr:hypothetical protein [Micromonosporaceae bacterium]
MDEHDSDKPVRPDSTGAGDNTGSAGDFGNNADTGRHAEHAGPTGNARREAHDEHAHDADVHDADAHEAHGHDADAHEAHAHDAHAHEAHEPTASTEPTTTPSQVRMRGLRTGLIQALIGTAICVAFIVPFIWALHSPGPRSVPIGYVGNQTQASAFGRALERGDPGAFKVTAYPNALAARDAILDHSINAALVPTVPELLVATAAGSALTTSTVRIFTGAAQAAGVNLGAFDVRPLHTSDPQGLSQTFFVVALVLPSLIFGYLLVLRTSRSLNPLLQLGVIAVYAAIVSAVATAIADAGIGALTGAPWGLFGIGTLLAFAVAVVGAAATRWGHTIGYIVIALLFIPIGISASGVTLGPNMITQWYADLGRALPPGAALPTVQNTIYFGGNRITGPLLILSAWAVAGAIALALAAMFHPPVPRPIGAEALADHAAPGAVGDTGEVVPARAGASPEAAERGHTPAAKPGDSPGDDSRGH